MKIDSSYSKSKNKFLTVLLMLFMASGLLMGCDENNKDKSSSKQLYKKFDQETKLEGLVSNNHGRIKAGTIKVTDIFEDLVASTAVNKNGHYSIKIPVDTLLPLVMTFYPDSADEDKLITVVIHPTITKYDINPLTSSIAKRAQALGGYTHANLVQAAEETAKVPETNKTTAGFRGDPTTQYGGWH
jgi:hypothetical protein